MTAVMTVPVGIISKQFSAVKELDFNKTQDEPKSEADDFEYVRPKKGTRPILQVRCCQCGAMIVTTRERYEKLLTWHFCHD